MGQDRMEVAARGQTAHAVPPDNALRLQALESLLDEAGLLGAGGGPAPEQGGLPGGPPPTEPWQGAACALTVLLTRRGHFSWAEWLDCLAAQIALFPAEPGESVVDTYYRQWLIALEIMTTRKGLAEGPALDERAEAWRRAYLATPAGQPVTLAAGRRG
jgi:nitrile hydratase accessory protein